MLPKLLINTSENLAINMKVIGMLKQIANGEKSLLLQCSCVVINLKLLYKLGDCHPALSTS